MAVVEADVDAGVVSIRLRSVGPEKFFHVALELGQVAFQSVSGLWDRRNATALAAIGAKVEFQSVSGLWDRRNPRRQT